MTNMVITAVNTTIICLSLWASCILVSMEGEAAIGGVLMLAAIIVNDLNYARTKDIVIKGEI